MIVFADDPEGALCFKDRFPVNRIRLAVFLLVAGVHGVLLYSIVFTITAEDKPVPVLKEKTIRLVSIIEEEPPPKPRPQSRSPPPQVMPENPPAIPHTAPEPVAATLMETEVSIPEPVQAAAEAVTLQEHNPVSNATGTGSAETGPGNKPAETALKAAYIKKNFDYIQRRIRDKLAYPPRARRAGIEGVTEVAFTIHPDGTVSGVSITASSGQELLDKAAIDAIYAAAPFRPPPHEQTRIAAPVAFRLR
ncbi:MAG: TonB family protein [Treponema sp.]|nr:TonB family protein [Treponema sp.]